MLSLMKSTTSRVAVVLVAAMALLTACEQSGGGGMAMPSKQTFGSLLGGVGGAVVGSQFGSGTGKLAAVAAGTLAGAFLGSEVGKSLDRADRQAMSSTYSNALENNPSGRPASWRNPDSGNYGTITPVRTYQEAGGQYCREYQQTIVVDGQSQSAHGTACRQTDGSWKIVN